MRVLITGANGHIGQRLIARLNQMSSEGDEKTEVIALVRSERAATEIRRKNLDADIQIVSYQDASGIRAAAQQCDAVVHLVGIIKQSRQNTFEMAHEAACEALVSANLPAGHVICLGIAGTAPDSANACFQSRARAEQILLDGPIPATIIRVPMVLGPEDYASFALARNARKRHVFAFRADSLEQPIYSEDVIAAILSALNLEPSNRVLELAGPESLPRRELIRRAGNCFNNQPRVISLPLGLGYLLAGTLEMVSANPPVTRAMLGVLDHDDKIATKDACEQLGLSLTGLDDMLAETVARL